ncbi:hypothetical protein CLU85_3235 [Acidovorax sp. 69]|uniref:WD40 repeat domain-containing protein n=1 Tax=Acidovorax sp. 69 TaxID=2035202 RepID=UPI000CC001E2|nr:WD40 repeat domain-containing protein [Acidovorax sp. 69]PJI98410.1 hypothetical protein CLU85_3235 [Acidovorax sp. 69]
MYDARRFRSNATLSHAHRPTLPAGRCSPPDPPDGWIAARLTQDPGALADETALWITGDMRWPELHLDDPLASGSPLHTWLQGLPGDRGSTPTPRSPFLILIDGHLQLDGALTCHSTQGTTHLIVRGNAHLHNAVIGGQWVCVLGALRVDELLWGHDNHGELRVHGGLQARVALFTDGYQVHIEGPEQVEFLMDEVRAVAHRAEFSNEILGAVFAPEFHDGMDAGEDSLAAMLDRHQVVTTVRAGHSAVHSSADIRAAQPLAPDLCADGTIRIENILAVVRTPVIAHKEHKAYGWFGQTDFSLCQRHVDNEGDQRDDNVFITVWKTWDFYLSVEQVPAARNLLERLAAAMLRRTVPTTPQLTLLYRRYSQGEPGDWQVLKPNTDTPLDAWNACRHAWRGVLDYVRKAVGQHRARYPLYQRLQAALTAENVESFTSLPVFTEQYNDWWDSDRNGYWEGEVWVGARQPCMHEGEPWGRALKFSWQNGAEAPGDDEDNAHSAYQINVDEAREGPAALDFTYTQRQSDSRTPLPRCAADHIARLLRFYGLIDARIRTQAQQEADRAIEARRIEATVHLLATPPLAADAPDATVFPVELMLLSEQWQTDGHAYVAAVRAQQWARGDANASATKAAQDAGDEATTDTRPDDPRKAVAPTVLQLARVVSAWADEDLSERFRQRFAFAPDAYAAHAARAGDFIGPVFALDDGRVIARIGAAGHDAARWVALQGARQTLLPTLQGLGRSPNRHCFAQSDGQYITTHQGFGGPLIARFAMPQGHEAVPANVRAVAGPLGQRCDTLIPFNDGQRVLLANPTGVYLLRAGGGADVQRIHPQTFDEDGPYTWPKNQLETAGGTVLALGMLHVALSPDERHMAVGDQDSTHLLLNAEGLLLRHYEPLSSYPHHAAFSHNGAQLFANACHFYGGRTLAVPLAPSDDGAEEPSALNTPWRIHASATQPGQWIVGDANGYLHALDDTGHPLWHHHIGSTVSAIDITPDGHTVWAASCGGYLVQLRLEETGMDPYSIGTSPYVEAQRWIFWSDEAMPLHW